MEFRCSQGKSGNPIKLKATGQLFDDRLGKVTAFAGQSPEDMHDEIMARLGLPAAIVSNDIYPIARNEIEAIPADDQRRTFEAIVLTPVRLTQLSCQR